MRIGTSFYYLTTTDADCIGRSAVISTQEVHWLVTLLLETKEKEYANKPVKIGLTFDLADKMAYWVNGK